MQPNPTVSRLLTNLRLLDYDFDAFPINPDVFTSLTNKGKAFEHIIYHLFNTFDPEECAQVCQSRHLLPAPVLLTHHTTSGRTETPRLLARLRACAGARASERRIQMARGP
jgi:hypothetical protein